MSERDEVAARFDEIGAELEAAIRHCRAAADHFRASDVPRACAHALALGGGLVVARRLLDDISVTHARHAV